MSQLSLWRLTVANSAVCCLNHFAGFFSGFRKILEDFMEPITISIWAFKTFYCGNTLGIPDFFGLNGR